jgi:hypothetical protein
MDTPIMSDIAPSVNPSPKSCPTPFGLFHPGKGRNSGKSAKFFHPCDTYGCLFCGPIKLARKLADVADAVRGVARLFVFWVKRSDWMLRVRRTLNNRIRAARKAGGKHGSIVIGCKGGGMSVVSTVKPAGIMCDDMKAGQVADYVASRLRNGCRINFSGDMKPAKVIEVDSEWGPGIRVKGVTREMVVSLEIGESGEVGLEVKQGVIFGVPLEVVFARLGL